MFVVTCENCLVIISWAFYFWLHYSFLAKVCKEYKNRLPKRLIGLVLIPYNYMAADVVISKKFQDVRVVMFVVNTSYALNRILIQRLCYDDYVPIAFTWNVSPDEYVTQTDALLHACKHCLYLWPEVRLFSFWHCYAK